MQHPNKEFSAVAMHLYQHGHKLMKSGFTQEQREDLIAQGVARACGRLHLFDGRCTLRSWVYRIVINVIRDECRRRRRAALHQTYNTDMDRQFAPSSFRTSDSIDFDMLLERVENPVARYTLYKQREGYSIPDVARELKMNVAKVRMAVRQAERELRAMVGMPPELMLLLAAVVEAA